MGASPQIIAVAVVNTLVAEQRKTLTWRTLTTQSSVSIALTELRQAPVGGVVAAEARWTQVELDLQPSLDTVEVLLRPQAVVSRVCSVADGSERAPQAFLQRLILRGRGGQQRVRPLLARRVGDREELRRLVSAVDGSR